MTRLLQDNVHVEDDYDFTGGLPNLRTLWRLQYCQIGAVASYVTYKPTKPVEPEVYSLYDDAHFRNGCRSLWWWRTLSELNSAVPEEFKLSRGLQAELQLTRLVRDRDMIGAILARFSPIGSEY